MPRKSRVLVPNCPHHIVQRGHNKNTVFAEEDDCHYYLSNLKEWKEALNIKLYAWCLMTNHIHLIVEPMEEAGSLSEMMKRINGRQTAYVNRLEGRSGSLWEGRFKASPIQRDNYLLSCCRYVELNPVRAGMVEQPSQYDWSSYRERMAMSSEMMLDENDTYRGLGLDAERRREAYEGFILEGISKDELRFISDSQKRNQLTGNDRFIAEIEKKIGLRVERRARGRPKHDEK